MKKGIILGLVSLFILTGCGNKVVCTWKITEDGERSQLRVTATFKNDKIDKLDAEISFVDAATAKEYCSLFERANRYADEKDKIDFTCDGKTLTFKDFSDYAQSDSEYSKMTKKEFIKEMEELKALSVNNANKKQPLGCFFYIMI